MRVLVVQNFDHTGLGQVGDALAGAGAEIDVRKVHAGDAMPAGSADHDAMVVLGGGQNALDDAACPYFPALLDLMRDFERNDRALLGICLGAQLLARAYGAKNQIGGAREFGWQAVERTDKGRDDPVLGAAPDRFSIFQWHDDTFSLPDDAMLLATNGTATNQAFRIGRAAYGVQFHFEADRSLVRRWNGDFADYLAETQPGWPDRFEAEAARHGPEADAAGQAIARAWVGLI